MTPLTSDLETVGEGFAFFAWYRLGWLARPVLAIPTTELFFWRRGAR